MMSRHRNEQEYVGEAMRLITKPALVEAFTSDEHACLFATMGFWQGIDVPGFALSQVVIDRLLALARRRCTA